MRSKPKHKISRKGLTVWRLYGVIQTVILAIVAGVVDYLALRFEWPIWSHFIGWGLVVLSLVLSTILFPKVRWERWRYEVREHEIEVQHGLFIVKRTIIPMVRVQHVDTTQGPILKKYDLGNISISTAATTHIIPALNMDEADALRARISDLARVAEDDV
ncbi:MAG TPA: PH domain-containing protein [Metalysinibacillus sp.]